MLLRTVLGLIFASGLACACDCIELPARQAKRGSEIVFRGTITSFHDSGHGYPIAVFQVNRVWKGRLTERFEMPAAQGDACFEFWPAFLKVGNELFVYASRLGSSEDYFPMPCNSVLARNAKDIQKLGPGRKPRIKVITP
jgi:hypothetical protein